MSICIAVPKHLIYVLPFSRVNTGIQGPINIIISLHRKNYVIITINRLIVEYLRDDYSIYYCSGKFTLRLTTITQCIVSVASRRE